MWKWERERDGPFLHDPLRRCSHDDDDRENLIESTTASFHEKWHRAAPSRLETLVYGAETPVLAPEDESELRDIVAFATQKKLLLVPAGLGTHPYLGKPPAGEIVVVSLRRFARIVRYEPDDFTVGVEAGTPVVALRDALRANRQEIPIDIFDGCEGTIGGMVAAQQPGIRHGRFGPLRSWIIGVHALDGTGRRYKAGGMVVKNVAGYEVSRFLPGTLGSAGFLLEINFKLRPLPAARRARVARFSRAADASRFAQALRRLHLQPSSLVLLSPRAAAFLADGHNTGASDEQPPERHAVFWLFEDAAANVSWQEERVDDLLSQYEPSDVSSPIDGAVLEENLQRLGAFDRPGGQSLEETGIARVAVLPSVVCELAETILAALTPDTAAATLTDVLSGLVTVRWRDRGERLAAPLARVRELVRKHGGQGALVYLPPAARRSERTTLTQDANEELRRRLLKVFDPGGIFCTERL